MGRAVMADAEEELARRRSDTLLKFLDDNMDVFGVNAAVEDEVELKGPEMVTGAVLIIRSRDSAGEGELNCYVQAPFALGDTELIGMVQRALWRLMPT